MPEISEVSYNCEMFALHLEKLKLVNKIFEKQGIENKKTMS